MNNGSPVRYTKTRLSDPTHTHCVACGREISKSFAVTGKVWVELGFRKLPDTEKLSWNSVTKVTEKKVTEGKTVPIEGYATGTLCMQEGCLSLDYRCLVRKHRDGSTYKIPRVLVDATPGYNKSIIPLTERIPNSYRVSPEETKPVNWRDPKCGPGKVRWCPVTGQTTQEL